MRAVSVAIAAASLTVVAGCGSSGSSGSSPSTPSGQTAASAYSQALQRVVSAEAVAQQRVAAALEVKTKASLRSAFKRFAADQAGLATELAALRPPADATAANVALSSAFADSAAAIDGLLPRIVHSSDVTQAFYVIQSDLATRKAGKAIGAALRQLKNLGYATAGR